MYCHDLEVMVLNPAQVELRAHSFKSYLNQKYHVVSS